jgi:hypothetical protein
LDDIKGERELTRIIPEWLGLPLVSRRRLIYSLCDLESFLDTTSHARPLVEAEIVDAWRSKDTMHSVGKFLTLFRKLNLQSYQVGGDEGYGHQLMDRMQEERFYLHRFNNGSPAKRSDIYADLSAEWWSTVGQLIERRQVIIPNDEKLIVQLTSRRKLYDSKGREKLESKADLRARGVESPDRGDALIGAIVLSQEAKIDWKELLADQKRIKRQMQLDYLRTGRGRPHIEWR